MDFPYGFSIQLNTRPSITNRHVIPISDIEDMHKGF